MTQGELQTVGQIATKLATEIKAPPTKARPNPTIGNRFKRIAAFDTFQDPQLTAMFEAAQKFAASVNFTQPYSLLLAGKTGTGKTHLARKVMQQFVEQNMFEFDYANAKNPLVGNTYLWLSWRKLIANLKEGAWGWMEDIGRAWFVVVDDIGAVRDTTGFATDVLDRVVSSRTGKWTIYTSNLLLNQISKTMDVRIADRLLRDGGQIAEVDTTSFAMRKKP